MVFSSLTFLFFYLPIVCLIYKLTPLHYRNFVLFISSLIFYGWGEPIYILLMLLSTVVDYINGFFVHQYRHNQTLAKRFVYFSIFFNLSLLSFFKYYDWIIGMLNLPFLKPLGLPLPLGISFYSFQTMTYPIDIYRQEATCQKNLFSFGAYVCMFPQLVAGPIVRYKEIDEQLKHPDNRIETFYNGICIFTIGLAKKVLIANSAGALYQELLSIPFNNLSTILVWIMHISFTLQIYFDFCGYSEMAMGLGNMLGFHFPKNFNYPYISKSIKEFWGRWHITLGQFFKDYVYIPLGGSRCGTKRTIINLFIVWFLTGLWHGADWNFVIWGLYFWFLLMIEKYIIKSYIPKIPHFIQHLTTLILIIIGFTIFDTTNLTLLKNHLLAMFGFTNIAFINPLTLFYLRNYFVLLIIWIIGCTPIPKQVVDHFPKLKNNSQPVFYILLLILCICSIASEAYQPFLYFRF